MFYEERVNDGCLEFRTSPKGEWRAASPKWLTSQLTVMSEAIAQLESEVTDLHLQNAALRAELDEYGGTHE